MRRHHWIVLAIVVFLAYIAWKRYGTPSGGSAQ